MLSQKQAKEVREKLFADMVLDGFTVEGRTKEGLAFSDEEGSIIVVKIVAKKDDFDLADAIEEFEEAQAKALEKEKKHAEKVEKAKVKKEKEETKAKEKEEKEIDSAVDKILGIIEGDTTENDFQEETETEGE